MRSEGLPRPSQEMQSSIEVEKALVEGEPNGQQASESTTAQGAAAGLFSQRSIGRSR